MKKFFSMMLIAAAAFSLAACGETGTDEPNNGGGGETKQQLETPAPVVKEGDLGEDYFTVSWDAVSGADSYVVAMKGANYSTTETSYKFEDLSKGEYIVSVKAVGKGYKDSKFGSVTVTVTGATSVSWFTQTASAREDEVVIDFTWKGENIESLQWGLFTTESANSVDDATIIAYLNVLDAESLALVNSEEGATSYFDSGLYGSTAYSLFAYVENTEGKTFLARTDVVTAEAKAAEEAKVWFGNWTAYTEKVAAYDSAAQDFVINDQRTDLALNIQHMEGTTNDVVVYGLSRIGDSVPAYGTVGLAQDGTNCLYIWSFQNLGEVGDGYYAYWLTYCSLADGGHTFVTGEFPAWMLLMDASGNVTCEMYTGELNNGKIFTAQASELFALNPDNGSIGFMSLDEQGTPNNVLGYGPLKGIQKAAAAQSVAAPATLKAANVAVSAPVAAM